MILTVDVLHTLRAVISLGYHFHFYLRRLHGVTLTNHLPKHTVAREVGVTRNKEVAQINTVVNIALNIYTDAIMRLPDFAEAYMARGAVKHHLKDLAGAAEDLKQALTLKPELAEQFEGSVATIDKKGCH